MTSKTFTVHPSPQPVVDFKAFLEGPPAPVKDASVQAQLVVDCRCHLGECVLWDDRKQQVVFISILDRTFHKLSLNLNQPIQLETFPQSKMIGAIGLLEDDNAEEGAYLVAWEDGFQLYNLETQQAISPMSVGESVNPLGLPDRLNDGRCDPTGKWFVCGGCSGNKGPLKVYQCRYNTQEQQLEHHVLVDSIQTTNSICWSLDGNTMYLANSPDLTIDQYTYHLETGRVTDKRHFHTKPTGFADGSCVDAEGFVWNATWRQGAGTGMVQRLDPTSGDVVFTVHLPDNTSEASCCCFGGPNLDILFITTAWEHLDPSTEPHAGGLYAVKLPHGMKGRPESRFRTT